MPQERLKHEVLPGVNTSKEIALCRLCALIYFLQKTPYFMPLFYPYLFAKYRFSTVLFCYLPVQ